MTTSISGSFYCLFKFARNARRQRENVECILVVQLHTLTSMSSEQKQSFGPYQTLSGISKLIVVIIQIYSTYTV